ncbi:MurR/RpiR family transcriptional regulator [Murdochiella vaginalis]|uniref:MurR/RpiR family transcriptional regulator n=1 Tax=Murdochiella vaginalis TaxID=1852373 RepID=UPI000AD32A54|nr:MurR/RpiR family transcriptional regulator [Murdochiella vaginalis]
MMNSLTVKEKISLQYRSLTRTEQKLAKFVLENADMILKSSISECATMSGVSEASIVRFSKSLGYKGFLDMKINLAKEVSPKSLDISPIIERDDSNQTIFEKIFTSNMTVLKSTFLHLQYETIQEVINLLVSAKRIFLFGTGGSQKVVSDAQHKFLKVGIHAIAYDDIDLQFMASSLTTTQDLVIAVSFSGANYNTMKCLEIAKANGTKIVSITSNESSPIQKISDYTIFSASDETAFQSDSVSTRIVQLTILDCLVTCMAMHKNNYMASKEAIMRTREATSNNKY